MRNKRFALFALAAVVLFIPQSVFCQTEKSGVVQYTPPLPAAPVANAAAMRVGSLVKECETNEVRANQEWVGQRVRVYGTVNTIEIGKDGNIVLTFKSSIWTNSNGRCFFNKTQSSRVAELSAHQEATVEGTVRGFDDSKAFLDMEDCLVS